MGRAVGCDSGRGVNMKRLKSALKLTRLGRFLHDRGYSSKDIRRQRLVNFIFQRIFRINSECRFSVHFTSRVHKPTKIRLGEKVDQSFLASGHCYIQAINGILIGDGTVFGPGVAMISANHRIGDLHEWTPCRPIRIGRHCWIGANAVILPGVELGDHTIVGAGTVVNRSYPAGHVIIINQRKLLAEKRLGPRSTNSDDELNRLQAF